MAGRIRAEDVALVKERTSIEDVVREHVTLRPAGVGSLKGLCPFHDEKSPSFHVRPALGVWHCFGCNEGGDAISFVQKVDHLTFHEAVERLAAKSGVELRYEEGGGRPREEVGRRTRLIEAHRVAAEFYAEQLGGGDGGADAVTARQFLAERGFDRDAAARFAVGYAPKAGETLSNHLRSRGFTDDELVTGGLSARGSRGLYDRFRGRLVWPIRDITGDVVGFGARRLFEDDRIEAKYLNTAESPIYRKATVLYGLDLAKKAIARDRQAVVVEGYTDVMACHLAGVETAIATCGTAFGSDHITVLRRIMRDEAEVTPAEVVFTFDGDAAGQKAAMRAFAEDQRFVSQTYVAVEPNGLDPCDLRQRQGDTAVRDLIAARVPLFEFAVRTTISRFDLDSVPGRMQALRAAAPVVAGIRDRASRPEYARSLAGLLGMPVEAVQQAVKVAGREANRSSGSRRTPGGVRPAEPPVGSAQAGATGPGSAGEVDGVTAASLPTPNVRDPHVARERQYLQVSLQAPGKLDVGEFDALGAQAFGEPAYRAAHDAIRAAGGLAAAASSDPEGWVERVAAAASEAARPFVTELAVAPLPVVGEEGLDRLAASLQVEVAARDLSRQEAEIHSRMQRLDAAGDAMGYRAALVEAEAIVRRRTALRERLG
ncbi:MAG: DNA primase [Actinomycetales bacterium]